MTDLVEPETQDCSSKSPEIKQNHIRYSVSGSAAHSRLVPLLPKEWQDCSPGVRQKTNDSETINFPDGENNEAPHFVWENAPRKESKEFRDTLKAYSHLPNGTAILDSKWVLARLLSPSNIDNGDIVNDQQENGQLRNDKFPLLATLESFCFRGPDGYAKFCEHVFSSAENEKLNHHKFSSNDASLFPDLLIHDGKFPSKVPPAPSNFWVIKDAFSNGAGGIWVVDQNTRHRLNTTTLPQDAGPLYEDHRYVAQRYAWPPVLFNSRKCHVRVYGLITADGRAFVNKRAFLHVANDPFTYNKENQTMGEGQQTFEDSVHITNCCANSHDDSKFAGEILADLESFEFVKEAETGQTIVPLGPFFSSMKDSLAALTERSLPFISGGTGNNGFEYLGMDFILSYKEIRGEQRPVAYLLEVNAPPSQDTATGLKHAEDLHDSVIRGILTLWVLPKVTNGQYAENTGDWRLAYKAPENNDASASDGYILPSKAAIINKIRWGMFERKATKKDVWPFSSSSKGEQDDASRYVASQWENTKVLHSIEASAVSKFARTKFPFFHRTDSIVRDDADNAACDDYGPNEGPKCSIFWENAGGSQVPYPVIDEMRASLEYRHRSIIGAKVKDGARKVFNTLLGAHPKDYAVFMAANATCLLSNLARQYVRLGLLQPGHEVVLSSENHMANVEPWLSAAKIIGAKVKWWTPTKAEDETNFDDISPRLHDLLSHRTRIVAITHASNVLGQLRCLSSIRSLVDNLSGNQAHIVVDGVAAVPHCYAAVSDHQVDWYVVSCHKLFGPHLGALVGHRSRAVEQLASCPESVYKLLEEGTVNYEACSGVQGLSRYFVDLATTTLHENQDTFQSPKEGPPSPKLTQATTHRIALTPELAIEAYRRIRIAEEHCLTHLLSFLRSSKRVKLIDIPENHLGSIARLPVISFVHERLSASAIVENCALNGIACRHGTFLSNPYLLPDFGVHYNEGVVRLSLVHYNTREEVDNVVHVLKAIPGWL